MRIENLAGNASSTCTGCHACFSVCPKSAIAMSANGDGFLYPKIDKSKCVGCGICEKVCPAISPLKKESEDTKAYAAIKRNEAVRLESSSGGIFTAIAEKVIEAGGVVFGAKFASDFSVVHGWTETADGLADFRGSKYLQSVIGESYKECKRSLEAGREVLFSGTPCQVQGLKKYLGKEYGNLLTVDFICHGVPSPLLWQKYVDYRAKKNRATRGEIVKTAFRRKDDGWKLFSLSFTFANDSEYRQPLTKDPYMQMFLRDVALRESCYQCPCRGIARPSDITLADFWGVQNVLPEMDDDKGTSFVISHSDKGKKLLFELQNCELKEIAVSDGAKFNSAIEKSPNKPKMRKDFYEDLEKLRFERIIKKYATTPLYLRGYRFALRCAMKGVKVLIRKENTTKLKKMLGK